MYAPIRLSLPLFVCLVCVSAAFGYQEIQVNLNSFIGNQDLGERDIFTINANGRSLPVKTMVLSVSDILQGDVSDRDLLTTIDSSLELVSEDKPEARVQFHPETGILIMRGDVAQIELISNLLEELIQAAVRKQQLTERDANLKSQREQSLFKQQIQMEMDESMTRQGLLEQEINRLRESVSRLEKENRALKLDLAKQKDNKE